ncbi:MAG: anthranilate synthase component I, partial [Actinomycetota bacterium]
MTTPSRDEFHALAADHTVVPVWRELLADQVTPVGIYSRLVGDEPGFLLESVDHGETWGRFSFVGRRPLATLEARGRTVQITGELDRSIPTDAGILAAVEAVLERYHAPRIPELPPLQGGLMGYLGYDVTREVEHLPDVPPDDTGHPDAVLSVIGELAAFDHWRQRVSLVASVLVPDDADEGALELEVEALGQDDLEDVTG